MARQAVRAHAHAPDGRFGYDPEAGMLAAYGEDLDALRRLGALLRDAFHDRERLAELIRNADPTGGTDMRWDQWSVDRPLVSVGALDRAGADVR